MAEAKKPAVKKPTKKAQSIETGALSIEKTTDIVAEVATPDSMLNAQDSAANDKVVAATAKAAKAGRRSEKGIKEAEAKVAKEERKEHAAEAKIEEENKPKQHKNATRTKAERAGKKYKEAIKLVDKDKEHSLKEGIDLAIKTATTKFDSTVEIHINLGVDPKQADQNVRDNFVLPAGTGKTIRIAVFAEADDAAKAKKAGADITDMEELAADLDKGVVNFDTLIATPSTMAKLGKFARTLGPKGLMPNPKSGTVTADVEKAVKDAKAGKVDYRVDSTGIVHLGLGKVSFGAERLMENAKAVSASIRNARPVSVKGNYVKVVHLTTSMGPSIRIAITEL